MYASVKEGEKRVSVIAHRRDEKKRSCPDEKICAGKEDTTRALWKRYIAYKTRTTTHVDDQTQQLVDFRLERERFGFFFSRHDDIVLE